MKLFIVLVVFAATASASLIASPAVGYNAHGLGAGGSLVSGGSLISGVRTIGAVGGSYVSPIATRVVAPISAGLVSPIGYGGQHVSRLGQLQQVGTLVSTPIIASVRTVTPIVNAVHLSPVATRIVAPVSTLNVHSAPIISNVVAPSLYANVQSGQIVSNVVAQGLSASHGSGLYAGGHFGKKL